MKRDKDEDKDDHEDEDGDKDEDKDTQEREASQETVPSTADDVLARFLKGVREDVLPGGGPLVRGGVKGNGKDTWAVSAELARHRRRASAFGTVRSFVHAETLKKGSAGDPSARRPVRTAVDSMLEPKFLCWELDG